MFSSATLASTNGWFRTNNEPWFGADNTCLFRVDNEELVVTLQKLFKLLDEEVQLNPTTDNSG